MVDETSALRGDRGRMPKCGTLPPAPGAKPLQATSPALRPAEDSASPPGLSAIGATVNRTDGNDTLSGA